MAGPYTYSDTPLSTQTKSGSQPLIRNNFLGIAGSFEIDHVAINAAADWGKHNFVTLPEQAASPTTLANEAAIFSRQGAYTSVSELCLRRESNGAVVEFTGTGGTTTGWTRLPSGILMKWGNGIATAGVYTYTFPVGATIPAFTAVYSVQVSTGYTNAADGDGFVRLNDYLAPWTTFEVYSSHRTTTGAYGPVGFFYLAIGV